MAYTDYFPATSGLNLYGKARPLNATWSTGIVNLTENSSTGEYSASTFADGTTYAIYRRVGGSPASSDIYLGDITPPSATGDLSTISSNTALIAAEIVKIPRASGSLSAGSSVRRTKVNITTTTLDEILEDTP